MVEVTSDDKKIFDRIGDAIMRKEPFRILVKGKKAKIFKKAYELENKYSKTKNIFVYMGCFVRQVRIASIWSCLTMAHVGHTVIISDLEDGEVLITGTPKEEVAKA